MFFRDTTQWSQLILLAVLVIVYVFNIKFLPLTRRRHHVLSRELDSVPESRARGLRARVDRRAIHLPRREPRGAHAVAAASRARCRCASCSGRSSGSARCRCSSSRSAIVGVTDSLLQVSEFMFAVSVFTITLMTFAIAGLALGFGTMFPQFETENAAQIPTSFGGLVFMMASIALIAVVIVLEARPVYQYVGTQYLRETPSVTGLWIGFGGAALVCLAATFIPIRIAIRRMKELER